MERRQSYRRALSPRAEELLFGPDRREQERRMAEARRLIEAGRALEHATREALAS